MELRSRSRSKTPFSQNELIESTNGNNMSFNNTRITRQAKLKTIGIEETYAVINSATTTTAKSHRKNRSQHQQYNEGNNYYKNRRTTSDYYSSSSEENDVNCIQHISENDKNQIIEDARAASNNEEISALNLYRQAGRYWDKYPKTDWTYSPHSRDRVEIAPGVVAMPNMSRRTIHSSITDSNQINNSSSTTIINSQKRYIKPQQLFMNENNNKIDEYDSRYYEENTHENITIIKRISLSIYEKILIFFTIIQNSFNYINNKQNSSIIWFGSKLHHFVSWIMLIDTWLLKKQSTTGRNNNKLKNVFLLCLIPLLLFGGWWLLSNLGQTIYEHFNNNNNTSSNLIITMNNEEVENKGNVLKKIVEIENSNNNNNLKKQSLTSDDLNKIILLVKNSIKSEQNSDEKLIENLQNELNKLKLELTENNNNIKRIIYDNKNNIIKLNYQLNKCCRHNNNNNGILINLESQILDILGKLLNDENFLKNQENFNNYLNKLFLAKNNLELKLINLTRNLDDKFEFLIEKNSKQLLNEITNRINLMETNNYNTKTIITNNNNNNLTINENEIMKIVEKVLKIYDADKTGLVDYAMESMGGQVITTKCTEIYQSGSAVVSILGIPLWYPTSSPRIVITSKTLNPGECWAFQNFPGFLVIKLSKNIKIDGFTVEHISKLLIPNGNIDSALKDFEVYGLLDENDKQPILLGKYMYDINLDQSLQYFLIQNQEIQQTFHMIELRILSNHGNPNYTCLYRFRVHGHMI